MNAAYFALTVIVAVLVIFWGSAEKEPARLRDLFGPRPPEEKPRRDTERRW